MYQEYFYLNYYKRTISLLIFVYKIVANFKVLANRIISILSKLIHCEKTGLMNDGFIGENIRTISDLITFTNNKNIPCLILLVDFEKPLIQLSGPI